MRDLQAIVGDNLRATVQALEEAGKPLVPTEQELPLIRHAIPPLLPMLDLDTAHVPLSSVVDIVARTSAHLALPAHIHADGHGYYLVTLSPLTVGLYRTLAPYNGT